MIQRLLRCFCFARAYSLFDNRSQDANLLTSEVDVSPLQTEQLTHAKSRTRNQEDQRPLSVTQTRNESVDFRGKKHFWYRAPLCALANEGDGIVIGEFVSSRVVKEHAHQVPNLGATGSGEWKGP